MGALGILSQGSTNGQQSHSMSTSQLAAAVLKSLQPLGSKYMRCTSCRLRQLEEQQPQACGNVEPPSLTTRQSADGESARQLAPDEFRFLHLPRT